MLLSRFSVMVALLAAALVAMPERRAHADPALTTAAIVMATVATTTVVCKSVATYRATLPKPAKDAPAPPPDPVTVVCTIVQPIVCIWLPLIGLPCGNIDVKTSAYASAGEARGRSRSMMFAANKKAHRIAALTH